MDNEQTLPGSLPPSLISSLAFGAAVQLRSTASARRWLLEREGLPGGSNPNGLKIHQFAVGHCQTLWLLILYGSIRI